MIGEVPTKRAVGKLLEWEFIDGLTPTPLGRAVCRHFLSPQDAFMLLDQIRNNVDPYEIIATMELEDNE
jgi:helicase